MKKEQIHLNIKTLYAGVQSNIFHWPGVSGESRHESENKKIKFWTLHIQLHCIGLEDFSTKVVNTQAFKTQMGDAI